MANTDSDYRFRRRSLTELVEQHIIIPRPFHTSSSLDEEPRSLSSSPSLSTVKNPIFGKDFALKNPIYKLNPKPRKSSRPGSRAGSNNSSAQNSDVSDSDDPSNWAPVGARSSETVHFNPIYSRKIPLFNRIFRRSSSIETYLKSHLNAIPVEMKLLIASLLDFKSLVRLSRTSWEWKRICDDSRLWQRICLTEWGITQPAPLHTIAISSSLRAHHLDPGGDQLDWKQIFGRTRLNLKFVDDTIEEITPAMHLKIVLLGSSVSGKTALVEQLFNQRRQNMRTQQSYNFGASIYTSLLNENSNNNGSSTPSMDATRDTPTSNNDIVQQPQIQAQDALTRTDLPLTALTCSMEENWVLCTEVNGKNVLVQVDDTSGIEEYTALRDQYIKWGQAFLLVYNVASKKSLQELGAIRRQIMRLKSPVKGSGVPIVVCGNNGELDVEHGRQVSLEEGEAFAKSHSHPFFEVSSLGGQNILQCFQALLIQCVECGAFTNIEGDKKSKRCVIS
eukprot:TRINITY_DN4524_c0_g1_i2.p1 TRINITY_DN4524_c0_g1~~TRINITY_DN4524_c0_g1_i2.p1  ORF type:complete len:504 (+),score=102.20 TRINITY_DN4524_c0_g1_i2:162-1673(+)